MKAGFSYGSSSIATGAGHGSKRELRLAVRFARARFRMDRVMKKPMIARTATAPTMIPTSPPTGRPDPPIPPFDAPEVASPSLADEEDRLAPEMLVTRPGAETAELVTVTTRVVWTVEVEEDEAAAAELSATDAEEGAAAEEAATGAAEEAGVTEVVVEVATGAAAEDGAVETSAALVAAAADDTAAADEGATDGSAAAEDGVTTAADVAAAAEVAATDGSSAVGGVVTAGLAIISSVMKGCSSN